jgi:hypothetical protein
VESKPTWPNDDLKVTPERGQIRVAVRGGLAYKLND